MPLATCLKGPHQHCHCQGQDLLSPPTLFLFIHHGLPLTKHSLKPQAAHNSRSRTVLIQAVQPLQLQKKQAPRTNIVPEPEWELAGESGSNLGPAIFANIFLLHKIKCTANMSHCLISK